MMISRRLHNAMYNHITAMQLRAINLTHILTIAGALFCASNLPAPKNPAFLRRTDPNALAAMMLTSRQGAFKNPTRGIK